MACCVLTAYAMNRLIRLCEILDVKMIDIKYNSFDDGDDDNDDTSMSNPSIVSQINLDGMTCASCVSVIETALDALDGVHATNVSLALSRARIVHEEAMIQVPELIAAVENLGYGASADKTSVQQNIDVLTRKARLESLRSAFSNATTLSMIIVSINIIANRIPLLHELWWLILFCTTILAVWVQVMVAKDIHISAWTRASLFRPSMDTLISLSILIGLVMALLSISEMNVASAERYLSSGSFLVAVVLGGRYVQNSLEKQISMSLVQLMTLQTKVTTAMLKNQVPGKPDRIPTLALKPGHEIVLQPRSIIPCDCYVTAGRGMVDESSMTGESLPKAVEVGDFLMSGTRLIDSRITAIVSRTQENSALEGLVSSISTAAEQGQRENTTDVFSAHFVRIILLLTLYVFVMTFLRVPPGHHALSKLCLAGEKAMTVLACACPCALGLATPSAVLSGISVAWSKGILFINGITAIRRSANLTHIVMDKTGTLTTGKLTVSSVHGIMESWHHMLVCAAEKREAQVHPVARSIFKWSLSQLSDEQRSEQEQVTVSEHSNDLGRGVKSVLVMAENVYEVCIGSFEFLKNDGICLKESLQTVATGAIVVHMAINKQHVSSMILQDTVRKESPAVVTYLREHLLFDVTMLTGDTQTEANRISSILKIPVAASRALPHAKKAFIQEVQSQTPTNQVAMLGDGVNDAPALLQADVGILISPGLSRSNKACVQAADVILTNPNLGGLVEAVLIARMTERQITFNRFWALCYNLVAVTVAMGGLERWGVRIDASMAGTLMAGSSISVVALSLMLKYRLQGIAFTASEKGTDVPKLVAV